MFLDHTQRRSTVGRTPLDEWSARRRNLYLTTHDTQNRQISMLPVGFKPKISACERPQAAHMLSVETWKRGNFKLGAPKLRMGKTPKPYTEETGYSKGRHTETLHWGRRNFERGTHRNLTLKTPTIRKGDKPKPYTGDVETLNGGHTEPYTEDTDYSKGRHTETLHWRHRLFERETRRNLTLGT
jgi:hypothetical protein